MAASHKTKVVAKNISRIALLAEETTKYIVQGYVVLYCVSSSGTMSS